MSCHECYIRFIITEPEGHRPEGEVIISLILQSGHDVTNLFHDFKKPHIAHIKAWCT